MQTNDVVAVNQSGNSVAAAALSQKVVIVNGSAEIMQLLEAVLEEGHYNVVFVESDEHAYSQIKRVHPNLIVLCVRLEDINGFQVLSMLKLDADTRDIPILTYTLELEGESPEMEFTEPAETEVFAPKPQAWMN
jgi:two-component system, OmpR family, phosphate regulon response regulator PhoB